MPSDNEDPAPRPPRIQPFKFALADVGFSLASDDETLRQLEELEAEAAQAAQTPRKFAWR